MIAFRVDANEHIASGHLMRCMALAMQLRKQGEECIFYMADDTYKERLKDQGFAYHILHSDWKNLEGELPVLEEQLREKEIEWLIVDSYQATSEYLRRLNQMVRVCYFDDSGQQCWQVAAVIHYSDWLEDRHYFQLYQGTDTIVMAGMEYTPLREEFYYSPEPNHQKKILLTTGGTDTYNVAGRFLEKALQEKAFSEYTFQVIIGGMNGFKEALKKEYGKHPQVELLFDVNCMGDLMRQSSYGISAGGTTLYELCACGVPSVCFSFAQNQEEFAKSMGEKQIMLYAGDAREDREGVITVVDGLFTNLKKMMEDKSLKENLEKNMRKLVDGKGTERIAKTLQGIERRK